MTIPELDTIKTEGEAQQLAIDWQASFEDTQYYYSELSEWQALFEALGQKYNLTDEFRENGIL